jgi:tRNA pseudouridine38-40 synthase
MLLLKLAYLGGAYHGFQFQPGVPTVEGELRKALKGLGVLGGSRIGVCCRTDRGVSARAQVVAFDERDAERVLPRAINARLPGDIWVWARAPSPAGFEPWRSVTHRVYRYWAPVPEEFDAARARQAAQLLPGTRDFSAFSLDKGETKSLLRVSVKQQGPLVLFEFRGKSFAREMVRRMAGALLAVGSGRRDEAWVRRLLQEPRGEGAPPAPPEGLVLWEAGLRRVAWETDRYALRRAMEGLEAARAPLLQRAAVAGALADGLKREMARGGG